MADGYGSKAKPVALDPFQQVVAVHWSPRLLTFSFRINRNPEFTWAQEFCDFGPPAPVDYEGVYLTGLDYMSLNAHGDFNEAKILSGTGWQPIAPSEIAISGLPSLPAAFAPAAWSVFATSHDNNPATNDGLNTRTPFGRWQEVTGSDLPQSTPDGGNFREATSAVFELIGQSFSGGPSCYESLTTPGLYQPVAPVSAREALSGTQNTISVAGVTVTYKDKMWAPIGIRTTGMSDIAANPINPGTFWVLCHRQT
ncbi:hypothetical protein [Mesorhizobium opportunistum]|uniref:Uncharacterized protein n=1 Tax=Mesorhizobium opportunistum (strain LMG 24607 / HAMBI 3007 / WSM2075) TaxID=536019 RepID=F7Y0Z3_MESOW|nr:hypothetical protein [Mesorhizobium opportunistum]AEH88206.1 hypothetical protein Mesop_3765 [Mesorhizobium opportunistum WSM2075]